MHDSKISTIPDAPLRILGIDPGLQLTGYGVVEIPHENKGNPLADPTLVEAGVLRFKSRDSVATRVAQLHAELQAIISEHQPRVMAVEKLYAHYKHPATAIIMAHARGVILLAAHQAGMRIIDVPSTEVKKAITGYGHASKEQMQRSIQAHCRLPEPPSPPDVADAIAIALTHARRIMLEQA